MGKTWENPDETHGHRLNKSSTTVIFQALESGVNELGHNQGNLREALTKKKVFFGYQLPSYYGSVGILYFFATNAELIRSILNLEFVVLFRRSRGGFVV